MRRILPSLILAAALAVPATASAGTMEVAYLRTDDEPGPGGPFKLYSFAFRADPGERNLVTVEGELYRFTVRDAGAELRAGGRCVPVDPHTVSCAYDGVVERPAVDLGDGDDELRIRARMSPGTALAGPGDDLVLDEGDGFWTFDGGPGADRMDSDGYAYADYRARTAGVSVTVGGGGPDGEPGEGDDVGAGIDAVYGGEGDDVLAAGAGGFGASGNGGDDVLTGSRWPDTLGGGPGDDLVDGAGGDDNLNEDPGADVIRGGAGFDSLSYRNRTAPLVVKLDDQPGDGEAGEGDDVGTDVERVEGGSGDDFIQGFEGTQKLEGGKGADRLLGGPGADGFLEFGDGDSIVPGSGADSADVSGNVYVDAADGEADLITCRHGAAVRADSKVDGLIECGLRPRVRIPGPVRASRRGRIELPGVSCGTRFQGCEGTVTVRRGARVLASRRVALSTSIASVHVRLNRLARRDLRRRGRRAATVSVALSRPGLPETTGTATTRVVLRRGGLPKLRRGRH
ncbi:MAG TPA: calcium-binding protein [Solirubrobacteraceae bacterium]|jgi:hypothetical protein